MAERIALITGVTGQDGSYLAERLLAEGTAVHGVVRSADDLPGVPPGVVSHRADVTDAARMAGLLREVAPDEVYNLAGISSVARSWSEPLTTAAVNGVAVAQLLEAVARSADDGGRPVRVVQASSAEIFGSAARAPQDESTPIAPVSPYGAAKAYAHLLAGVYRARGLHASSLILYNHESPRRPESFVTRKITRGVARIAGGAQSELVLGNLDARRDWGWAPDYVDAMIRAARAPLPGDYVIATGRAHSVREFVAAAFSRVGIDDWQQFVRVDPALLRPADPVELVGDAGKARAELGWSTSVGFDEIVGVMVDAEA